ncbi:hypothetical protein BDV59DRAFT_57348 [Aspergillus ambiguus]|uniref:uncharacterized protein n=1 Tax=Aspergillus ambiguus TaxID=176160 RepID=UPI003CCD88ED
MLFFRSRVGRILIEGFVIICLCLFVFWILLISFPPIHRVWTISLFLIPTYSEYIEYQSTIAVNASLASAPAGCIDQLTIQLTGTPGKRWRWYLESSLRLLSYSDSY